MTDTKISLGQRLRSLAMDRGKTSPSAGQELTHLAQEVDALEELKAAVTAYWVDAGDPEKEREVGQALRDVETILEELEAREARR